MEFHLPLETGKSCAKLLLKFSMTYIIPLKMFFCKKYTTEDLL